MELQTTLDPTPSGLGQNQTTLDPTLSGLGQNPTTLDTTPSGSGQNPTTLDSTPSGLGQNQATLDPTLSGLGQNQTTLDATPSGLGQNQTTLDPTLSGLGQNPTTLDTTPSGSGQNPTTLDSTPSGSGQNQPTSLPSSKARPSALTRLEAFKIMMLVAKKLIFSRPRDIPNRTRVKLVEKLLGFEMFTQSLDTQKKIISSIYRFICKYETMYENCQCNINIMKKKHRSLVSKEFRLVHPSNLVFHNTPYSKIYTEDARFQLIEELLVSVHSDLSKTSMGEARPSALTRLEAFKIMLRVSKKLKHCRPRELPNQTKVKLVEKLLGFEMSAQALDTQKKIMKSIVGFIYKYEDMYRKRRYNLNSMEKKHKSLISKEFRLVLPSDMVFHATSYNKIDDASLEQFINETLIPEEKGNNSLLIEDNTTTVEYKQKLWSRKEMNNDTESGPPPKIVKTLTETVFTDPEAFNQENQDTSREDIYIFKTEFNQEEELFLQKNQDTNQDDLNISKTCCFCNTHQEDCVEITDSKPYVTSNRTKIVFNNMSIEINKDTTLKLVCQHCDSKLVEMHEFVKLVSEAQNRLTNDDLNTNFEMNTEEATSSCSDDDFKEDTVSLSNYTVEDELICDTESIEQTTIGRKRIGEKEDLIIIKKCRNNDYNNDPLSFNDEFKCKEEVDDKELVKDAILANTVTGGSEDSGGDNEITVKKEFTDEGQLNIENVLNERENIDKDNLIMDIKEESKETGDGNDYTELPQHEKGIKVELTELYQDEEFSQ